MLLGPAFAGYRFTHQSSSDLRIEGAAVGRRNNWLYQPPRGVATAAVLFRDSLLGFLQVGERISFEHPNPIVRESLLDVAQPAGLRQCIRTLDSDHLRRVPIAVGDGVKRPLPSEAAPLRKMGKQLVAARPLPAGHVIGDGDLVAKSPADEGLPPYRLDELIGLSLLRALAEDEAVLAADVAPVPVSATAN